MAPSIMNFLKSPQSLFSSKTPILFLGATGYIGGSVLVRLLGHPSFKSLEVTALVRSEDTAKKLKKFGVKTAIGTLQDHGLLESLAAKAHIVFSIASSGAEAEMQAILRGLKRRNQTTGDVPLLIRTSGTGTFATPANGMFARDLVYNDADPEQISTLPLEAFNRSVDVLVEAADKEGYARTYIVLASTIYGIPDNVLTRAGIQRTRSIQIPALVRAAIARGQGGMVGEGKALWNNISNDDTADLYITVYDRIIKPGNTVPHGREGYFVGENGTYAWYELCRQIAQVLHEKGIGKSPEPTSFTEEELAKYFGSADVGNFLVGSNSRAAGNRSRAIGWVPKHTTEDMLRSIRAEVETEMKSQKN